MAVFERMDYDEAVRYREHGESQSDEVSHKEGGMNESMEENKREHKPDGHSFCSAQLKYTYRKAK